MKRLMMIVTMLLVSVSAHAWDCNYWSQSTNPSAECYKPPGPASTSATATATQGQTQGQGQTQYAKGGSGGTSDQHQTASGGTSTATGGTGYGGTASTANNGNNAQTSVSNSYVQAAAPPVINPIRLVNCGVAVDAGGSGVRGAGAFGITVTTEECWNADYAAMEEAAGRAYDACELRRVSKTEQRAIKNGAHFADCKPPEPIITRVTVEKKVELTPDEIAAIKQQGVAEYLEAHPAPVCPVASPVIHHHRNKGCPRP